MAKKSNGDATLGRNVTYRMEGEKLILEIDTSEKGEPSGSGKTIIIGTTQGNKRIGDVHIGLNVYRYPDKKKK